MPDDSSNDTPATPTIATLVDLLNDSLNDFSTPPRNAATRALRDFQELAVSVCRTHHRFGSLLWTDSASPEVFLNSATPASLATPPSPGDCARALELSARSSSTFSWWGTPPDTSSTRLCHDGMVSLMEYRSAPRPPAHVPSGTTLSVIEPPALSTGHASTGHVSTDHSSSELAAFFALASNSFDDDADPVALASMFLPLVQHGVIIPMLAYGTHTTDPSNPASATAIPVGTLLLHLSRTDPTRAGIYWVSVTPAHRRTGVAAALMEAALAKAAAAERSHVVLQATPMAESLYRRLGFHLAARIDSWVLT